MLTVSANLKFHLVRSDQHHETVHFVQPEESMSIQHTIGADIIMQLDDVGANTGEI